MRLLLALGLDEAVKSRAYQALLDAGPVRMHVLPAEPSRSELDPILNARDGATLVVAGADPGLNTVVTRLVRRGESADLPMAVLPSDGSALGRLLGLPTGITAARVAVTGEPTRRGLVRDDHGGVLLTGATLSPWQGRRFGARAYTDETEVANRLIRRLAVRPGDGCLRTTVRSEERFSRNAETDIVRRESFRREQGAAHPAARTPSVQTRHQYGRPGGHGEL